MKTFLKLLVAVSAFGFATANANGTYADLAAAKAAVVAAVTKASTSTSTAADLDNLKTIVSNAVAQFPESAGVIVSAGLKVSGITESIQIILIRVATWTAPSQESAIVLGIAGSVPYGPIRTALKALANRVANAAKKVVGARSPLPPINVS